MHTKTRGRTLTAAAVMASVTTAGMALACTAPVPASAGVALPRPGGRAALATARHPQPIDPREVGGPLLARTGVVVRYPPHGVRPLPKVPASAYVIADASTGAVLAAKDAHGLYPPASTLKVLTAITMLPLLKPNAMVVATKRAASVEPNIVGLIPGHRYQVADLFRALLIISANDAAVSLVQACGSFTKGMALINAEAHHLQAYDVVAKHPNGLPAPGQVVSAYDLALIARRALAMPAFMRYDSTLTASFPLKKHKRVMLVNQNYLLTKYRGGLGGKIGWTEKAEATYIGLARRNGVTLIVTILHATPLTEIASAERLLNWGFAAAGKVRPVGVLVPPLPSPQPAASQPAASKPARSAGPADAGHALAGTSGGPTFMALGVGAVCLVAIVLAGVTWLRRRAARRRPAGD